MFYVATLSRACAILPGKSCPKEKFREARARESFLMGRSTGAEGPMPGKSSPRENFRETLCPRLFYKRAGRIGQKGPCPGCSGVLRVCGRTHTRAEGKLVTRGIP